MFFLKYIAKNKVFHDTEHETAWFITVTRNYCKDVLKTFWRKKIEFGEIPDTYKEETEEDNIIEKVMKLPPKYKEVLYLYYYEEYSIREMSKILHRNESTIQTQLAVGRKKLKIELDEGGYSS